MTGGVKRSHCRLVAALLAGVVAALLASCPNPIPISLAAQITDREGPLITITSPADGDTYQSAVTINGFLSDPDGTVQTLELSAPALDLNEAVEIDADGRFEHSISTIGLTASMTITLTATDWNGNETSVKLSLENDLAGPYVEFVSPADYSGYSTIIQVIGSVTDAEGLSTTNEVSACSYRVPGTGLGGNLDLNQDGAFGFDVVTRLPDGTQILSGPVTIEVSARDWNGNSSSATLTLIAASSGDIPGFTVIPGDRQATFEWDDVALAQRYLLRSLRDGVVVGDATSPYVWSGLTNAARYSFQLIAEISDGQADTALSAAMDVIPLSAATLRPRVRETAYDSVTIDWPPIEDGIGFVVERRTTTDGPWQLHAMTTGPSFRDATVEQGQWYAYRVYPAIQDSVVSEPAGGTPSRFRSDPIVGSYRGPGEIHRLAVDYPIAIVGYGGIFNEHLKLMDITDPTLPYPVVETDLLNTADISIVNGIAYIMNSNKFWIYDVSPPGTMDYLGSNYAVGYVGDYEGLAVYENMVYGALGNIQLYDVTKSAKPCPA